MTLGFNESLSDSCATARTNLNARPGGSIQGGECEVCLLGGCRHAFGVDRGAIKDTLVLSILEVASAVPLPSGNITCTLGAVYWARFLVTFVWGTTGGVAKMATERLQSCETYTCMKPCVRLLRPYT